MALTDAQFLAALPYLGVVQEDFFVLRRMPFEEGVAALEELKARMHRHFRRKSARDLHPDLTGNDSAKAETFRTCVEAMEAIDKLKLVRPQQRLVPLVHISTGSSGTRTTFRNVTIRVTVS